MISLNNHSKYAVSYIGLLIILFQLAGCATSPAANGDRFDEKEINRPAAIGMSKVIVFNPVRRNNPRATPISINGSIRATVYELGFISIDVEPGETLIHSVRGGAVDQTYSFRALKGDTYYFRLDYVNRWWIPFCMAACHVYSLSPISDSDISSSDLNLMRKSENIIIKNKTKENSVHRRR